MKPFARAFGIVFKIYISKIFVFCNSDTCKSLQIVFFKKQIVPQLKLNTDLSVSPLKPSPTENPPNNLEVSIFV